MTDLINSLEALAGKVTLGEWSHVRNPENTRWIIDSKPAHAIACTAGFEPDNEANAAVICLLRNNLPTIIAAIKVAELVRDEDWLAGIIKQSDDDLLSGEPEYLARAIITALPKETDNG